MDNSGITPVMPVGGMDGGWGNGSFMWIFGLLILLGLFNGGWGGFGGGAGNVATQNDVQRGFDTAALQDQSRDILGAVNSGTAQAVAATNQAKYDNINVAKDIQMALSAQIGDVKSMEQSILGNQNECCCSTKMLISETGAGINAAIAGLEQRLTAKMDANTIQSLRDQVEALRDQVNMSGVLRFPNSWSYGAGQFPPIFGGCCGNA